MNYPENSQWTMSDLRPQAQEIKSDAQQFADEVSNRIIGNFPPEKVLEIVTEIRKFCIQSLNNQAEQARINSKEYADSAEQIAKIASQL